MNPAKRQARGAEFFTRSTTYLTGTFIKPSLPIWILFKFTTFSAIDLHCSSLQLCFPYSELLDPSEPPTSFFHCWSLLPANQASCQKSPTPPSRASSTFLSLADDNMNNRVAAFETPYSCSVISLHTYSSLSRKSLKPFICAKGFPLHTEDIRDWAARNLTVS